jgi:N-acetylated-alpha-linked acidic dipeptidase
MRRQFSAAGMQEVVITTHEVLLPKPLQIAVEMIRPRAWRATLVEDPIKGDRDTELEPSALGQPYLAYSASGAVTAPLVYAGAGMPADYDWLAAHGVEVRGAIILARYSSPYSYRGFKAYTAQQRGAAGVLLYSDPAESGSPRGKIYPDGPWGPETRIERGAIAYDFIVPGDPLTPGWASVPGAKRIAKTTAASLPRILAAPISARDARVLLASLSGPVAPRSWQGALAPRYRAGPGPATVRLRIRMDDSVRSVWTVTGLFRGSDFPDEIIVIGNHRDAWIYGGIDPSGGTAALADLARRFGVLTQAGWRPKRSILFASWDAEEFAVTSSTEWVEQHETWLRARAAAYLNVDSGASGSRFVAGAVPSLMRVLAETAQAVRDPASGLPIAALARDRRAADQGSVPGGADEDIVENRLGGGSDYTPFLNFLGVPSADLSFKGAYGVYHSLYDTHEWVARHGDPGFRYHAALADLWGIATLRLANADALPLDPEATARSVVQFVAEAERRMPAALNATGSRVFTELRTAAQELKQAAAIFARIRDAAVEHGDAANIRRLNARMLAFERAFLDPEGLPGRPWYRHLLHAPRPTYEPEVLPGIVEALDARDDGRLVSQGSRLSAALRRAAGRLSGN